MGGLKEEKKRVRRGWDDGLCVLERGAGGLTGVWVGCWCCWLPKIGEFKVGECGREEGGVSRHALERENSVERKRVANWVRGG